MILFCIPTVSAVACPEWKQTAPPRPLKRREGGQHGARRRKRESVNEGRVGVRAERTQSEGAPLSEGRRAVSSVHPPCREENNLTALERGKKNETRAHSKVKETDRATQSCQTTSRKEKRLSNS